MSHRRPQLASPGEQQLARQLEQDSQLGPLFGFNQRVSTIFENRFLVNLLWAQGRVVVEIDGYDRRRSSLTESGWLSARILGRGTAGRSSAGDRLTAIDHRGTVSC